MEKTMLLITSSWGSKKTFKMIPASSDSVYNEAIFDLDGKVLALISKEKKDSLHMLPKLNEFGDPEMMKIGKRANGKEFKEERKNLETYYEYYIEDINEIKYFIERVAINASDFNFNQYLESTEKSNITSLL
jgi:hypothetical protein